MAVRERLTRPKYKRNIREGRSGQSGPVSTGQLSAADRARINAEVDGILKDIDEVLTQYEEELAINFVQKGGE